MIFACCGCGAEFSISPDKIPSGGLNGSCHKCRAAITVYSDGRTEIRGAAAAAAVPAQRSPIAASHEPDAVEFACPSCARRYRLPLERVPVEGAAGSCATCKAKLLVFRDGTARLQGEPVADISYGAGSATGAADKSHSAIAAPPPVAPSGNWEIQFEGQTLGPFTLGDIKQLVLADRLPPERLIRPAGGEWAAAMAFPAVAGFFAPHETAVPERMGSEDGCFAHQGVLPTHQCSQCARFLCSSCIREIPTPSLAKPLTVCSACGGPLIALKRRARWTPFYRDLKHALSLPLKFGHSLLYFVILTVAEMMKVPCSVVPIWGTVAILFLTCFQTSFYIHLVKSVGNGCYDFPEWPDMDNFLDMLTMLLKVIFVSLVALFPVILLACLSGAGLGAVAGLAGGSGSENALSAAVGLWFTIFALLALFYIAYLPVCIAIVAIFNTVIPALNPVIIFKIIARIGPTYFLAVAIWASLGVIEIVSGIIMFRLGLIGGFLIAPVEVYIVLVSGYVLGRVAYENEEKIGWH